MPGIVGVCGDAAIVLDDAIAAMVQFHWHVASHVTASGEARGACVALTSPIMTARVVEHAGITAWIHGELYGTSDAELARDLFAADAAARLARIDGNYSVVAWHRGRRHLRIATDRLGLRHLYRARTDRGLVWASEAKACAIAIGAPTRVEAATELFEKGHLDGASTWFCGVELVPAATLLVYEPAGQSLVETTYWRWPDSPLVVTGAEAAHLRERIVERWHEVHEEHRSRAGAPVLTLSGGQDSRAIFAALQATGQRPHCVTFGRPRCLDVTIARDVAARAGVQHDVCELTEDNWFDDRELSTWITDGQFDLLHMHVLRCLRRCVEVGDVVYNGFLGDALLGGLYLSTRWSSEERYRSRGRRFISEGTRMGEAFLLHRLPFCDRELVELSLAVPEALRRNGWFYGRLLRETYPTLFGPIAQTPHGARPSAGPIRRVLSAARYWWTDRYHYHAYPRWLTTPRSAERLAHAFSPLATVLDERVWRGPVERWQRAVARGRPLGEMDTVRVMRLAGMGIWLDQVQSRIAAPARQRLHRDVA